MIVLSILLFAIFFPLNVIHFRKRKIPLYSIGSILAILHIVFGIFIFWLIPVISLIVAIGVELYVALLNDVEKGEMEKKYVEEEIKVSENIEEVQKSYEKLFCLSSYTVEMEWQFRKDVKILESNNIWYYTRNGLITSLLIKPEDEERAVNLVNGDSL